MKIAIATDAWLPQVNGVVRTYENIVRELELAGHTVCLIAPGEFRTFPCPTYPSIGIAIFPGRKVRKRLDEFEPDAIHIATEGPIGHAARSYCLGNGYPFTTSFHTQFPEYIKMRFPVPLVFSYAYLRRFHNRAMRTFVPTTSQQRKLQGYGFKYPVLWPRGVNTTIFRPKNKAFMDVPRPLSVYAGRVAVEKNITAFLDLDIPGTKLVIGDGPDLEKLGKLYPDVLFAGFRFGEELASYISAGDVFVFPSTTDTFGIVMLEALACGVPVAAYPVTGPIDIIESGITGVLDNDLKTAVMNALHINPAACVDYARQISWQKCAEIFIRHLSPVRNQPDFYYKKNELVKNI